MLESRVRSLLYEDMYILINDIQIPGYSIQHHNTKESSTRNFQHANTIAANAWEINYGVFSNSASAFPASSTRVTAQSQIVKIGSTKISSDRLGHSILLKLCMRTGYTNTACVQTWIVIGQDFKQRNCNTICLTLQEACRKLVSEKSSSRKEHIQADGRLIATGNTKRMTLPCQLPFPSCLLKVSEYHGRSKAGTTLWQKYSSCNELSRFSFTYTTVQREAERE